MGDLRAGAPALGPVRRRGHPGLRAPSDGPGAQPGAAALAPVTVFVDGTGSSGTPAAQDAGRRLYAHVSGLTRSGIAAAPDGVPGPPLARWYPDYVLVLDETAAAAAASAADDDEAQAARAAPRYTWNAPLAVRTAEIRIVTVPDGAIASDVLAGLTALTPGHRLLMSAQQAFQIH
jgi:hypothetical protein